MQLKKGVNIMGVRPELVLGMLICNSYFESQNLIFVVTSVVDDNHSWGSLHYSGSAFDVRIWGISPMNLHSFVVALKARLGSQFDVVLECDHIHVEFQPKK